MAPAISAQISTDIHYVYLCTESRGHFMNEKKKKDYTLARKNAYRHIEKKVLLSDDELAEIKRRAASVNLKPGTFMRKMSVDGEIISYNMEAFNQIKLEVHRVGNNINQIAHLVNETQTVTKKDIDTLEKNLSELRDVIKYWIKRK